MSEGDVPAKRARAPRCLGQRRRCWPGARRPRVSPAWMRRAPAPPPRTHCRHARSVCTYSWNHSGCVAAAVICSGCGGVVAHALYHAAPSPPGTRTPGIARASPVASPRGPRAPRRGRPAECVLVLVVRGGGVVRPRPRGEGVCSGCSGTCSAAGHSRRMDRIAGLRSPPDASRERTPRRTLGSGSSPSRRRGRCASPLRAPERVV